MGIENHVAQLQLGEVEDENMCPESDDQRFDLNPKSPELELLSLNKKTKLVCEEDGGYNEKIKDLQGYLDTVVSPLIDSINAGGEDSETGLLGASVEGGIEFYVITS